MMDHAIVPMDLLAPIVLVSRQHIRNSRLPNAYDVGIACSPECINSENSMGCDCDGACQCKPGFRGDACECT